MSDHNVSLPASEGLPVILLVGGFGTRMGSGTQSVPKPLVEIGERPILWHIMKLYAHYGHTHFIFPLGFQGQVFRRYFLEYEDLNYDLTFALGQRARKHFFHTNRERDWRVTLFDAGLHTEKGARVRKGFGHTSAQTVLMTYGDGIGDVDLDAVLAFHRQHGKLATMSGYQPTSHFGIVDTDEKGQVTALREKPRQLEWINIGFFVFERGILDYLAGDDTVDLERTVLPQMAADGQLMMYRHTGFWDKMDTIKEARQLSQVWQDSAPWKVWHD